MKWALLALDNEALTQEGSRQLNELRAAIQRLEKLVSDHDRFDVPAFQQWESLVCADLLSCKRELEELLWLLRTRLSFVYTLRERGGYDDGEAFFWFAALESGNRAVPPEVERLWRDMDRPEADGQAPPQKRWTVAGDGVDTTGDPDARLDEEGGNVPDETGAGVEGGDFSPEDVRDEAAERVKALYRKIVRLLHPDAAGSLSGTELELWHKMQAAYQEQDVFTLELILARCARAGTKRLRYSELLALVGEAQERLAILNRALIVLAERPSWRFRQTTLLQRQALERDARTKLELEIARLWHERRTLENRLSRMEGVTRGG